MPRFLLCLLLFWGLAANAGERVLLQSTTSTQNSGLYDYLLPFFEAETGFDVQVVAVGTGRAIRNAQNGDGDLLIVHARDDEDAFVAAGYGVERFDLMYNDFIIIGPQTDPAQVKDAPDVKDALARIHASSAKFISRGDESGTHKKELRLWQIANLTPGGSTYIESGSGMGATIRMAIELQAYTLTDRATWIAFQDKRDADIAFADDPPLNNQYGVIMVNPDRHPHINFEGAQAFQNWLLSPRGQDLIGSYRVDEQQLFFPNAN